MKAFDFSKGTLHNFYTVHPDSGCWEWNRSLGKNGYGRKYDNGRNDYAHRVVYRMFHGAIPEGMEVCHSCDNRKCIRPDHLYAGTHRDNQLDALNKGRLFVPPARLGESHHKAKLTKEQVRAIRERCGTPGCDTRSVAMELGVHPSTVRRVVRGATWAA